MLSAYQQSPQTYFLFHHHFHSLFNPFQNSKFLESDHLELAHMETLSCFRVDNQESPVFLSSQDPLGLVQKLCLF